MFSEAKARRVTQFIECLRHTKGEFHGQPFKLLPWQETVIRDVFGTVRDDDPSMRQYNTAYIEIPKKNGKSELGAAIALNMLCNDDEWRAEVYSCASDRQQAAIVFDVAVDMVKQSPALSRRIKIIPSTKRMVFQPTGSIYQVLSSEVATKHGLNVSACITSAFMPTLASGNKTILFGDMGYYWVADREGRSFKRLNELYAPTGQVGFLASQRVDGKLILAEAVQCLQQA